MSRIHPLFRSSLWVAALLIATPVVGQSDATPRADIEARLDAARRRLEAAAREVAELSTRSADRIDHLVMLGDRRPRALIGVQLDPEPVAQGVRVLRVSPGGPAAEAGIESGDVITEIDGKTLQGLDNGGRALVEHMRDVEPEQTLRLKLLRDGRTREVTVVAGAAPGPWVFALPPPPEPGRPSVPPAPDAPARSGAFFEWMPHGPSGVAGLELATLTPGLGTYFGVERGVLVLRAPRDPAWKLEDGDVLIAIDGREPATAMHATRILHSYRAGETVKLRILRRKKAQQLEVEVPAPSRRRDGVT